MGAYDASNFDVNPRARERPHDRGDLEFSLRQWNDEINRLTKMSRNAIDGEWGFAYGKRAEQLTRERDDWYRRYANTV